LLFLIGKQTAARGHADYQERLLEKGVRRPLYRLTLMIYRSPPRMKVLANQPLTPNPSPSGGKGGVM
jgi:hypothetical protein